jgi:hypothetical protein
VVLGDFPLILFVSSLLEIKLELKPQKDATLSNAFLGLFRRIQSVIWLAIAHKSQLIN